MISSEIEDLNQLNQFLEEGKIKEAYQFILELEQRNGFSFKEKLTIKLHKAKVLLGLGDFFDAINIAKDLFREFQEQGDLISAFDALIIQGHSYMLTVNLILGEKKFKQAEDLLKIIKETTSIDLRERESKLLLGKAGIIYFKGDIQLSLEINNKAYELAKSTNKKPLISGILNNIADKYHHLKEYDKGIEYAKAAIKYNHEPSLIYALGTLIEIYISRGDIQAAKISLEHLRNYSKKLDTKRYKAIYYASKANILKSSLRARDRIKAEDIFKELALDESILSEPRIEAIIGLCELYLTELRITNDPEILNELERYIQMLLNIAEQKHLYLYMTESYILQAKLSLLTFDINVAKKFLTKAQKIAEMYGLKRLAMKISYEHDELLKQIKLWDNYKELEVSLSERLKLAGLNEQIEYITKKRMIEVPELSDEEPILLLIVSEGGIPVFTQSFISDKSFEDHLFGGFFTAINTFINEMFSEGLDRASFGEHTLLMNSIPPFLMCYVYKGQSYSAQKRVNSFIRELKSYKEDWEKIEKFYQTNRKIKTEDIPSLETLINKVFIEKTLQ
jgi:hypothetical protein